MSECKYRYQTHLSLTICSSGCSNHMVIDLTGIPELWTRPVTIHEKNEKMETLRLNKNQSAVTMPASTRISPPPRPLDHLLSCSPMLQSWYVFTSSHISSTVIKTIMKLRNSSFAERSMVESQTGRRTGEVWIGVLRNSVLPQEAAEEICRCVGCFKRGVAPFGTSVLDLRSVQRKRITKA